MPTSSRPTISRWRSPKVAVDKGFDEQLETNERCFLYMPFQHSENLADQNRPVLLFTELGDDNFLSFAKNTSRHYRALRPLPAPQRHSGPGAASGRVLRRAM